MAAADVLDSLKQAGLLTEEQVRGVQERHAANVDALDKQAQGGLFSQVWEHPLGRAALTSAGIAAAGAAAKGVGDAASKAFSGLKSDMTWGKDYGALLESNPRLKDMDAPTVQRAFHTVRKLMPDIASDPITAGPVVNQLVSYGGEAGLDSYERMLNIQRGYIGTHPDSTLGRAMSESALAAEKELGTGAMREHAAERDPLTAMRPQHMAAQTELYRTQQRNQDPDADHNQARQLLDRIRLQRESGELERESEFGPPAGASLNDYPDPLGIARKWGVQGGGKR